MTKIKHETREAWLRAAAASLRPMFAGTGAELPPEGKLEVIASWPHGRGRDVIGQCFDGTWTEGGIVYATVSPTLGDPIRVLDVLLHELVHACGIHGHGSKFKKVATAVGLTGPMRATRASPELAEKLKAIAADLGPYPHVVMRDIKTRSARTGKLGSRVRLVSPVDPEYVVEISRSMFEKDVPYPLCPISGESMEVAS